MRAVFVECIFVFYTNSVHFRPPFCVPTVQEVQSEGKYAIDSPGNPSAPVIPPEDYNLAENEQRAMIQPQSLHNPGVQELLQVLRDWVNDELAEERIIVKDLEEDLFDGQVLHKLWEKLTGRTLADVQEVSQNEHGQRQKLTVVLSDVNHILGFHHRQMPKWSVESIHSKNLVPIIHLLVALARHFRAPIRLPENVFVSVVIVQKNGINLNTQ